MMPFKWDNIMKECYALTKKIYNCGETITLSLAEWLEFFSKPAQKVTVSHQKKSKPFSKANGFSCNSTRYALSQRYMKKSQSLGRASSIGRCSQPNSSLQHLSRSPDRKSFYKTSFSTLTNSLNWNRRLCSIFRRCQSGSQIKPLNGLRW